MLKEYLNSFNYRLAVRKALRPVFSREKLLEEGYSSQYGQDKWVAETLLPGRTSGTFVDVGAHDGVAFSNTLFLEKRLGWTGLAVEPNPEVFETLRENRRCTVVRGCVAAEAGRRRFQLLSGYTEMLSGLADGYDPRHRERIERELALHGGARREIEVDCYTLNGLLEAHGIKSVDYLSIDVENAELAILSSLDWGQLDIKVIGVENAYNDSRIPRLLRRRGYRFHSVLGDEFYVK